MLDVSSSEGSLDIPKAAEKAVYMGTRRTRALSENQEDCGDIDSSIASSRKRRREERHNYDYDPENDPEVEQVFSENLSLLPPPSPPLPHPQFPLPPFFHFAPNASSLSH